MNCRLLPIALSLLGSATLVHLSEAQSLTVDTLWNFDNDAIAVNTSPAPSTGSGTASTLGMNVNANSTHTVQTVDTSDVTNSAPVSSEPGVTATNNYEWRIRGGDGAASPGNGTNAWTSSAAIGTQGAQFLASTVGFSNIQVSFDWSPTGQGEGKLQLEYTLDGTNYFNVPASLFTSLGTGASATAATNSASANTVQGGYLVSGSSSAYMNGITANLSSIAGANNDPNFGIRLVNAATGADDTTTSGSALNNSSGNWRFDEVNISGNVVPEPGTYAWLSVGLIGLA
ncbi:MAG: hypothetical protein JO295_05325, partial [Verrucomicrobia bacterium]|nr:hypothetical protein [Verrucomicrobiota bacterium]